MKKNAKGQAVSADAYQEFILNVVKEHDGIILEDTLDERASCIASSQRSIG